MKAKYYRKSTVILNKHPEKLSPVDGEVLYPSLLTGIPDKGVPVLFLCGCRTQIKKDEELSYDSYYTMAEQHNQNKNTCCKSENEIIDFITGMSILSHPVISVKSVLINKW